MYILYISLNLMCISFKCSDSLNYCLPSNGQLFNTIDIVSLMFVSSRTTMTTDNDRSNELSAARTPTRQDWKRPAMALVM